MLSTYVALKQGGVELIKTIFYIQCNVLRIPSGSSSHTFISLRKGELQTTVSGAVIRKYMETAQ